MIGFPDYIKDPQKLKEKYDGVSTISAWMLFLWYGTFQTPYVHFKIISDDYGSTGNDVELRNDNYTKVVKKTGKQTIVL